jgi:KipI family sensor histidine kinase inhibitor
VRVLPYGRDALLVDLASPEEVDAVHRALRGDLEAGRLPGVVEVVPAARTVLVAAREASALDAVRTRLDTVDLTPGTLADGSASDGPVPPSACSPDRSASRQHTVELPVHYDGEDLELVAADAGIDPAEVAARHTAASYTVAFGGFAPGFAYLAGLPGELQQPRLDSPRPRIPTGAVGVAGEFSGVYPRASPGGWRLIGRLADDAPVLFDPDRDPPALLVAGTRVRFRDAG